MTKPHKPTRSIPVRPAPTSLLPDQEFYSIRDAADLLRVGRSTLYREIKAKGIATHKIGWRTIIRREDLERLLTAGR